jgi:hypothetical protein
LSFPKKAIKATPAICKKRIGVIERIKINSTGISMVNLNS